MENFTTKLLTAPSVMLMMALATTACSKTASSNVKTEGIYAFFSVKGDNVSRATCEAQFQVGGATGTYLELDAKDEVTCQGQPMTKTEFLGIVKYTATVGYNPSGLYIVRFSRSEKESYVTSITMPEPIQEMNPRLFTPVQKNRPFTATWLPSANRSDEMTLTLSFKKEGSSSSTWRSGGRPEAGSVTFAPDATSPNSPVPGMQKGQLTFERFRVGSVPAPLQGAIRGSQVYSVPVELID